MAFYRDKREKEIKKKNEKKPQKLPLTDPISNLAFSVQLQCHD